MLLPDWCCVFSTAVALRYYEATVVTGSKSYSDSGCTFVKVNSNKNSGCYLLYLHLPNSCSLKVGALGTLFFKSGYYIYVGRAKRNLRQRVERHFRKNKRIRWHIDYLLERAEIVDVLFSETLDECRIAREISVLRGSSVVKHFGASDCRCCGHLVQLEAIEALDDITTCLSSFRLSHLLD